MVKEINPLKITDVIHYYQGCDFVFNELEPNGTYFKDKINIISVWDDGHLEIWGDNCEGVLLSEMKLLLRRVEDITDEEMDYYYEICKKVLHKKNPEDNNENILSTVDTPESFAWNIKNRFDIFGLIEKGYAMDIREYEKINLIVSE